MKLAFMPSTVMGDLPLEGNGALDLNRLLIARPSATFFMSIKGNNPKYRVFENDILVVDRSLEPHRNSLVVAQADEELKLARLIELQQETVVWGVVRHIIHRCL